jgi:succinate dehydrogenase / fumarate reductase iron-sulfur subunit
MRRHCRQPFRAAPFPVMRDLTVNRNAFERIIQAGGFITERCGAAPDANALPIPKTIADLSMDAAACIGCGACAAACPNSSAMLFVSAKTGHLGLLPQGKAEKNRRILKMVRTMDRVWKLLELYACGRFVRKFHAFILIDREYTVASVKETIGAASRSESGPT